MGDVVTVADEFTKAAFHVRLGRVVREMERREPYTLVSRAIQIAKTWRSLFAWHLAIALGWGAP